MGRGRGGAPPRGWWPSGRASVSEAGGPGLGSSLARALFCVAPLWFRAAGRRFFVPLPWFSTSGRKHGSAIEAPLLRRSAVFLQASEALRLRCFLTNFLCKTSASWFVFLEGQDPWLRAKKLLLLVRRSPLNAACQLLYRSPLAVAPVLRNFAAGGPPLCFLRQVC